MRAAFWFTALAIGLWLVAMVAPALSHGDLAWPAEYRSAAGTPCCTGGDGPGMGDCTRLPEDVALGLRIGSQVNIAYPGGQRLTTVNAIYESPEAPVICAPGCLFTRTGA
jgi:hypothetical protein